LETPRKRNKYSPPPTKGGRSGGAQKRAIFGLVEGGGRVKTFHIKGATAVEVRDILTRNVKRESKLYTDEARIYTMLGKEFASHDTVTHSLGEYVRGTIHTITVENGRCGKGNGRQAPDVPAN
jgi:hypothetical protein